MLITLILPLLVEGLPVNMLEPRAALPARYDAVVCTSAKPNSGREAPGPVHGPDPHGPDPHDEHHDAGLPANKADDESGIHPSTDPYNDSTSNNTLHPFRPY